MKKIISSKMKLRSTIFFFIFCSLTIIQAQNDPQSICKDGDCPPSVFNVKMNEPLEPIGGIYTAERTKNFKEAYLSFQQIKKTYAESSAWKSKYNASQLGGKSCLRHYQLEGYFANECTKNPDFKKFIESQESNVKKYLEKGFESNLKGVNLETRMKSKCPEERKKVEKEDGPELADLPKTYQNLGRELEYFDKDGNLLKPLPTAPPPAEKLSKKQQVEQLKDKVNALPAGQQMADKIGGIASDLQKARPKLDKLKNFISTVAPLVAAFMPGPLALLTKVGKIKDLVGGLLNFKPKLPKLGLFDKLKGLFKKGEDLEDKAKGVDKDSKKLKDKLDDLDKKAKDLEKEMDKRNGEVGKLQQALDDLKKKKAELTEKLNDKPKKILDELKKAVGDAEDKANDLKNKAEDELKKKDDLLKKLDDLEKAKEKIEDEFEKLKNTLGGLNGEADDLEKEAKKAEEEVEEIKKKEAEEEAKVGELKEDLENLKSEDDLKKEITLCEEDLKALLAKINPLEKKQSKFKKFLGKIAAVPGKILGKINDLAIVQNLMKKGKDGIPLVGKALAKVDGLLEKGKALGSIVEILTGKKSKLQERVEGLDQKVDNIKDIYDSKLANLDGLKKELVDLVAEKSGLKDKLYDKVEDVNQINDAVKDFINRYNLFDEKSDCVSLKDLEDKIEEVEKEQAETEPELEELEKELEKATEEEAKLEEETKEVEKEIEKEEELKAAEEEIKEEFGKEIKLDPVTVEEWTEEFEVEREYWDAVFHPDDEVIDGYVGRYFQVRLKDAEKNVKLLFGPGEYFMEKADFRDKYGSVIGAFVKEALHSMKKADADKIKLFVQGSADAAGQNTFRGNLNTKYLYNEVTVLPQKDGGDNFENTPSNKVISEKGFTNTDLPNLRGNYLKEMISIYSKKLKPILLEGSVKEKIDTGDRNAVIYLFIPEILVEEYGGD